MLCKCPSHRKTCGGKHLIAEFCGKGAFFPRGLISGKSLDVVPLINKIRQILKEGITPA